MEVIPFASYTEQEKLVIATRFLVPRQISDHGLKEEHLTITEAGLLKLIREYTRESGVRSLNRENASLCRKVAKNVASGDAVHVR